ncbi:hypothetical protein ACCO45_001027 [Purpureocillium lilacinum]|uniref:Uncharacterized protein n=1 Tax=Purpureocillium lilacinum TaxID=33203 RepID=A0ACC4E724_PURLI
MRPSIAAARSKTWAPSLRERDAPWSNAGGVEPPPPLEAGRPSQTWPSRRPSLWLSIVESIALAIRASPAAVLDLLAEQAERPLRWASMPSTHRPLPWLVAWRSHGTSSPKPGQSLCSLINSHMSLDCYYNLPVSVRSPGSTAAQGPLRTRLLPAHALFHLGRRQS